jgi:hypothetical protein
MPALFVTMAVRMLFCPAAKEVGDPESAICRPEPVVGVILSSLLPHPLRQQNRTKRIKRFKKDKNFFLVDFAILLSLFLRDS